VVAELRGPLRDERDTRERCAGQARRSPRWPSRSTSCGRG